MTQNKQMTAVKQVSQALTTMESNIALSIGNQKHSDRFMRIAQSAIQDPYIAEALNKNRCDRSSLYMAITQCAQDGLVLDKREAALVMFNGKVQYMPMVAGIQKKVWNSDQIESLSAHVVYEKDNFSYQLGDDEHIHHIPCDDDNPGEMIKVYAIAKLKGGGIQRVVMNKRQVMKHKAMAKTDYIWKAWPEEQWEKTAIKKLAKRLPQSSELDRVFEADNKMIDLDKGVEIADVDPETGEVIESKPAPKKKTGTRAASKVKAASKQAQPAIDSTATVISGDEEPPMPQDTGEFGGDDVI